MKHPKGSPRTKRPFPGSTMTLSPELTEFRRRFNEADEQSNEHIAIAEDLFAMARRTGTDPFDLFALVQAAEPDGTVIYKRLVNTLNAIRHLHRDSLQKFQRIQ